MAGAAAPLESLLQRALAPVEPPAELPQRLERRLTDLHELAFEELESWELSAMRDPRNWARPAAALIVAGGAGGALVVLRTRRRATQRGRRGIGGALGEARGAARGLREGLRRIGRPRPGRPNR